MHCQWVKTVWFASKLGVRFGYTNNAVISLFEWLEQIICNEEDDVIQLVLSICNGSDIPCAVSCYNNALKVVHCYNSAEFQILQMQNQQVPLPNRNIRWCLQTTGSNKLNGDAAGPSENGKWGLSTVIRDADGFVAAAGCWYMPILPDSNVAEALALLKGLQFAKDLLFLNVQAESDSRSVITAIEDELHVSTYLGTIVNECIKLSPSFAHVRRVANQAAHYLAKFALSSNSDFVWIEETPSCISTVVALDLLPQPI